MKSTNFVVNSNNIEVLRMGELMYYRLTCYFNYWINAILLEAHQLIQLKIFCWLTWANHCNFFGVFRWILLNYTYLEAIQHSCVRILLNILKQNCTAIYICQVKIA